LAKLLEHVRDRFARYDAGGSTCTRATQKLWNACVRSGGHVEHVARLLESQTAEGEQTDWWELAAPRHR
jgi:hypothetical protein